MIRLLRAIGVAVLEHIDRMDRAVCEWANSTAGPTWEEDES